MDDIDKWHRYLDNMKQIGFENKTVAGLVADLAGLPPMMEVYIEPIIRSSASIQFIHDIRIEDQFQPPFLLIRCAAEPLPKRPLNPDYDQRIAEKKDQALNLGDLK